MADLYGTNSLSSSHHDSEEMSSFLHNLLQNSSSGGLSTSPLTPLKAKQAHSFNAPPGDLACSSGLYRQSANVLPDSDYRFSDLSGFFPAEAKENLAKSFSSAGAVDSDVIASSLQMDFHPENDVGDFDFGCEVPKGSDVPENSVPPRSSKRTRAAEIHNLSEKRRRSRINEKLKALQTLIPNSNKTDKASMLDEAIEYLKQLQLQVQMLTMRNELGMQPALYLQEAVQPMPRRLEHDEGDRLLNLNGEVSAFSFDQKISTRRESDISNQTPTDLPIGVPTSTNIRNAEPSFPLELSMENHYGLLNHLASAKDFFRFDKPSKLQTDLTYSGRIPSPGVSS